MDQILRSADAALRGLPSGLPDPVSEPQFYAGVPSRRLFAFFIDFAAITALAAGVWAGVFVLGFATFFAAWALLPLVWIATGLFYRIYTIGAGRSATPGMRLLGIEFRTHAGERFDMATATAHTLGFYLSIGLPLLQLISAGMMIGTPRGRGLTDAILGSTAINTPQ